MDQTNAIIALTIDRFDDDGGGETIRPSSSTARHTASSSLGGGRQCPDGNRRRCRCRTIRWNAPTGCGPSFAAPSQCSTFRRLLETRDDGGDAGGERRDDKDYLFHGHGGEGASDPARQPNVVSAGWLCLPGRDHPKATGAAMRETCNH